MPTVAVEEEDLTFHYTDSGAPQGKEHEYTTFFVIHGYTFHSDIFRQLFPLGNSDSVRFLCIDRRGYRKTAPYTFEEMKVLDEGSDSERQDLLAKQGVLLAFAMNNLIQQLGLPINGGGALVGWSLGNVFSLAVINAISNPTLHNAQLRLKNFMHTFILWDPPAQVLGTHMPPEAYYPLTDPTLPPEDRSTAFGVWISSYFDHKPHSFVLKDISLLNQRHPSSIIGPTIETMGLENLFSVADFTGAGPISDNKLADLSTYVPIYRGNAQQALFRGKKSNIEIWGIQNVFFIYGDKSAWGMIHAAWVAEEMDKEQKNIKFKSLQGGNHFAMWDNPESTFKMLKGCVQDRQSNFQSSRELN